MIDFPSFAAQRADQPPPLAVIKKAATDEPPEAVAPQTSFAADRMMLEGMRSEQEITPQTGFDVMMEPEGFTSFARKRAANFKPSPDFGITEASGPATGMTLSDEPAPVESSWVDPTASYAARRTARQSEFTPPPQPEHHEGKFGIGQRLLHALKGAGVGALLGAQKGGGAGLLGGAAAGLIGSAASPDFYHNLKHEAQLGNWAQQNAAEESYASARLKQRAGEAAITGIDPDTGLLSFAAEYKHQQMQLSADKLIKDYEALELRERMGLLSHEDRQFKNQISQQLADLKAQMNPVVMEYYRTRGQVQVQNAETNKLREQHTNENTKQRNKTYQQSVDNNFKLGSERNQISANRSGSTGAANPKVSLEKAQQAEQEVKRLEAMKGQGFTFYKNQPIQGLIDEARSAAQRHRMEVAAAIPIEKRQAEFTKRKAIVENDQSLSPDQRAAKVDELRRIYQIND